MLLSQMLRYFFATGANQRGQDSLAFPFPGTQAQQCVLLNDETMEEAELGMEVNAGELLS